MRKRMAVLMAAGALAAGMLICGLAVRPYVDPTASRYPGSQVVGEEKLVRYLPISKSIVHQGTYQTTDPLTVVREWYLQRLQVLPSHSVELPGDHCVWMGRSLRMVILRYSASVLLCPVSGGTRITLNEGVDLYR